MSSKYAYQNIPEDCLFEVSTSSNNEDLGEQIRKQVKNLTNPALIVGEETEKLAKQIDALERLSNNIYSKKYPRTRSATATGLTAEQCTQVLSTEFLQYLNDEYSNKKR